MNLSLLFQKLKFLKTSMNYYHTNSEYVKLIAFKGFIQKDYRSLFQKPNPGITHLSDFFAIKRSLNRVTFLALLIVS